MYASHWQLTRKPFDNCVDPEFYFPGETHQSALLKLRYAVENRQGGALLAGPSGSGKTLLAGVLQSSLGETYQPIVHLVYPQMSSEELLAYLADELAGPTDFTSLPDARYSVRRIRQFLDENTTRGRHAVVIVDEAQLISESRSLETLRLLMNFESAGRPGLSLLLVGQTGILPILERAPMLEERLGVKCLLRSLTEQETTRYVHHRLKMAGTTLPIFEPESLPVLHGLTHGIPRRINRLCDLALLVGYAEGQAAITASHLRSAAQGLVAVA